MEEQRFAQKKRECKKMLSVNDTEDRNNENWKRIVK